MSRLRPLLLLGAVLALLTGVGVAGATTGATTGYPQPKVSVPATTQAPFEGRYLLTAVGSGAGIRSGEMKFEFEEGSSPQFLVGISQFYTYNPSGQIEAGLYTFYPPRELANGKGLGFTALKVGASATYGQVTPAGELTMFKAEGNRLKGELKLHGGGPWPVEFRVLGEDERYTASPEPARQIHEAEPNNPGWGSEAAEYEGEYELANAEEDPTAKAGTLGAVVGFAESLGAEGGVLNGGSMTVQGDTAQVTIETAGQSKEFTLTKLAWEGDARVAQVHAKGQGGPMVGRFEGTGGQGEVKGTLDSGHSTYRVDFKLKS